MWNLNTIEWLDIELTSFCNIACKGCFREVSKYSDKILNKEYLSLDTIKERFKKEDFPAIKIINFCGSVDEPTSHPQFFKIIEYFADWNAHINIATNGSLRTAPWWAKLAGILPESHQVTWGIDGTDETSEVYRVGSKFVKVEQNYKAFIGAGGLGEPIVTGLALNDTQLILQGAIPAAILAVLVELLFELLERVLVKPHMLSGKLPGQE